MDTVSTTTIKKFTVPFIIVMGVQLEGKWGGKGIFMSKKCTAMWYQIVTPKKSIQIHSHKLSPITSEKLHLFIYYDN